MPEPDTDAAAGNQQLLARHAHARPERRHPIIVVDDACHTAAAAAERDVRLRDLVVELDDDRGNVAVAEIRGERRHGVAAEWNACNHVAALRVGHGRANHVDPALAR